VKRTVPIGLSVIVLAFMLWFAFRSLGTATSEQNETRRQVTRDSSLEARERPVDTPRNVISRSRPEANVQTDGRLGGSDDAAQVRTLAQAVDAHTVASVREALAINAQNADKFVDKLCDKSRTLYGDGGIPAPPQPGNRDAALFMARMIDYEKPLDNPPGLLHLPRGLVEEVEGWGATWPSKLNAKDAVGMDFSWLEQLGQFDRWSVLAAGPLQSYPPTSFLYEPLPNYRSLMVRAKYRYVLSFETRDFMAVSQHVRHFADLLRTQGLIVSEMSAAALYHADAEARFGAANLGLDVSNWAIPDATKRKSWTQMTAAGLFFTLPGVSEATVRKALACMDSPCSAIVDGIGLGRSFVAYGGDENLNMLTNLATSRNCESEVIDRASQMPAVSSSDALMVMTSGLPKFFASQ